MKLTLKTMKCIAPLAFRVINHAEDTQLYLDVYRKYSRVSGKVPCVQQDTSVRGSSPFIGGVRDNLNKRKLQPSGHSDAFGAYLALCLSGVGLRRSRSLSQITPVLNSNLVHADFNSLCGSFASLPRRSSHENTNAVMITGDSQNSSPVSRRGGNTRENSQLRFLLSFFLFSNISVNNNGCSASRWGRNVRVRPRLNSEVAVRSTSRRNDRRILTSGGTVDTNSIGPHIRIVILGDCDCRCHYCGASFWAKVDESINAGRGSYVFKVSGHIYHWIGSLCPPAGERPSEGRLFQQYVVGAFCTVKQNQLDFIRKIQNDIRSDYLSRLYDAISRGERDGYEVRGRIILPMSFIGGQRYMYAHYLDVLAICRELGNPQFFITFTCNCSTVNSKKGLPHCGPLLWVDSASRIRIAEDIDRLVLAELPDPRTDPEGYNVVSKLMMHGPYGAASFKAPCMKGDKYSKNFPKKFNQKTFFDENGHVHYQRRDTGASVIRNEIQLDNSYIVPYNRDLLLAFQARINVEYYGWSMLIKYLFKYISKGTDRVFARVSMSIGESSTSITPSRQVIDKIRNYVEGRFICAHEAYWRILMFDIHCHEPVVQILAVNLEDMQRITFRDEDRLESEIDLPGKKNTTLTEWFAFNEANEVGRHLSYLEFPSKFVWYSNRKSWPPRKNSKSSIGRLTYVHPTLGELFFLRMLLCHQKGCRVFWEVQTVNGVFYPTYRAAYQALGLLGDDKEWGLHLRIRVGYILYEIEVILSNSGKSLHAFGLPSPPQDLLAQLANRLLMEERNYNREELAQLKDDSIPLLNAGQRHIYDLIGNADTNSRQELIFVYGCNWENISLENYHYIRWSLRDIVDRPSSLFDGKSVLLGGDFQQTLPVKKGVSKMEIISSCISESALWPSFKFFMLNHNMRLAKPDISLEERRLDPENTSWVYVPPAYYLPPHEQGLSKPINFIYDQSTLHTPSATSLQQKAIVCPKNEIADIINSKVLDMVAGESTIYMSQGEATPTGNDGVEIEMLYPIEPLNTFKLLGFSPHQLELKVGALVMLLRNVNIVGGLCNGTRMIVRQLMMKLIEVQIITETRVGEKVFLYRIPLIHNDPNLPFVLKRKQFPMKLCYAMTINKSQG
nr:DNA helicase [Tanacetum cinerariifolium]